MRRVANRDRVLRFITSLARKARHPARIYLTGGATAVLLGWRASTIDVDILIVPEDDALLRALPELKEEMTRLFEEIVPQLYRYPAIDPPSFRKAVEKAIDAFEKS
jgi:hypothetical protein